MNSALALFATVGLAFAANEYFEGPVFFHKAKINIDKNSSISITSGATGNLSAAMIANRSRIVDLPISAFALTATGVVPAASGTPKVATINSSTAVQWVVTDNDTKVQQAFRVPTDYVSGATFTCMVSLGAASADTTVGYEIYVNTTGVAFDAATTTQSFVAVTNGTTLMQDLSLAVATDTFAAGDLVTFRVWRHAGTGASSTLSLYGCHLTYTADM